MRKRAFGLLCLGALLAAAALPAAAGPSKPFDQLAPENATLYVSARNVADFVKRFEASPIGEAWNGPEMRAFVARLSDAVDLLLQEAGKTLGYSLKDYKDLLQGEAALIVGDPAAMEFKAERPEFPLAILIDVGARKEKAREFLQKNLELIDKDGKAKRQEVDFRGTKLILIEGKEPKPNDLKALVLCVADDLFAISLSQTFLQDMLANRAEASVKPLTEHPDYRMLRGQFGKDSDFFAYAHVGRWIDNMPKIAKAAGGENAESSLAMVTGVLDTIGLASVRSVVLTGSLSGEGFSQTLFVHTAGAPKGLFKVFASQPQPLRFPAIVPDDVNNCSLFLIDFDALWAVVENVVTMAQGMMAPGGAGGVNPLQAFEEQLQISIKRDLFGSFGRQVIVYDRLKKPYNIQSQATAFLIELKNKAKFQAAFEKLIAMVPFLQKKEYLGRTMYTMGMPGMEEDDKDAPRPPMPAICITDTHFVFANQKELAEEVIRRIGKEVRSVTDTPAFKALEGKYPPSATLISYGTAEGFDFLFYMAKEFAKGNIPGLPGGLDLENADPNEPGVKAMKMIQEAFDKLPDATVFTKRILGGIGWGFVEEKGVGISSKFLFKTATPSGQ